VTADFPSRYARTQRFTLGEPRNVTVSADGARVLFLRSRGPEDPVNCLWTLDTASGHEVLVADPHELRGSDQAAPDAELVLRERARESAEGIVAYATDRDCTAVVFSLGGHLYLADLDDGGTGRHPSPDLVIDPRLSHDGLHVAYVADGALRCVKTHGAEPATLAVDADAPRTPAGERMVTWGLADFIAAEELDRHRGFWWDPAGERLVVARVDSRHVTRWYLDDLSDPQAEPRTIAYPAAGTANADVSLHLVDFEGNRVQVMWDPEMYPYVADVRWDPDRPLTVTVLSRDQRHLRVLVVDPDDGSSRVIWEDHGELWLERIAGSPRWLPDGRLVHTVDSAPRTSAAGGHGGDTRRLAVNGAPVSPEGLQVRRILSAGADGIVVAGSWADPTAVAVWRVPVDGGTPDLLTPEDGVHDARVGGRTVVVQRRTLADAGARTVVHTADGDSEIASLAETPPVRPEPRMLTLGERALRAALLLPNGHAPDGPKLPVLLDPYGGPHAQRVLQARDAYNVSQWFADQGFAVLVTDGRGTPGRGPVWEHAVAGDLASPPLEDQVDALHAAAEQHAVLDLDRVAIRGWSFGGYLAALAVLARPDVFSAAIAGAPVTDWRLYDTAYTERYLGHPEEEPEHYERTSLLPLADRLQAPLLLIHGLADDNVVAAHTLQLSAALLAAGRPHNVLPLSNVTHMTPQVVVAENLLRLQLAFLQDALGLRAGAGAAAS
jgi:dipeptidyl-peptidase 4